MTTPAIDWRSDYEAAMKEAARRRSLALVHFADGERPLSRAMDTATFVRADVIEAARAFVAVRVDPERRPDLFETIVGGRGALATAVVDPSGDVVSVAIGYSDPDSFAAFLQVARAGHARLVAARTAARRRSRDPTALQTLAETYERLGSGRRAEKTFGAVVALLASGPRATPASLRAAAVAHERLARAQVTRGRPQEARAHLAAYTALDPDDRTGRATRARFTLALALFIERRLAESLKVLEPLVAGDPAGEDAPHQLYVLGTLQHEMRDDTGGMATLERLRLEHALSRWAAAAQEQIAHIKNPEADHQH